MNGISGSKLAFDLDEVASGAMKGWLVGSCAGALWILVAPAGRELNLLWTVIFFEIPFSLWFVAAVAFVAIPCSLLLNRFASRKSPNVWALVGALAFVAAYLGYGALFTTDRVIEDGLILSTLAGLSGGITLYFAKKQSDASGSQPNNSLSRRGRDKVPGPCGSGSAAQLKR